MLPSRACRTPKRSANELALPSSAYSSRKSAKLGDFKFLAQGTLYPDVIESATAETADRARSRRTTTSAACQTDLKFKLVEPLRYLFKDEVRRVGLELGLPDEIVWRQPFPARAWPCGSWARSPRAARTLRDADAIVVERSMQPGCTARSGRSSPCSLPIQSVGVMGDCRTYDDVVAVRAVTTDDCMTADWAQLPYDVLAAISTRIVNEVRRREPRCLRHHLQATCDYRVGVRGMRNAECGLRNAV